MDDPIFTNYTNHIMNEAAQRPTIVVDVQPTYDKYYNDDYLLKISKHLRSKKSKKMIIFDLSGEVQDTPESVYQYLELNVDGSDITEYDFIPKSYGFFRQWMSTDRETRLPNEFVLYAATYLATREQDHFDEYEEVKYLFKDWFHQSKYSRSFAEYEQYFPDTQSTLKLYNYIEIPSEFNMEYLKQYNNCDLVGGAADQCLAEVSILLQAYGIKHRIPPSLVWSDH